MSDTTLTATLLRGAVYALRHGQEWLDFDNGVPQPVTEEVAAVLRDVRAWDENGLHLVPAFAVTDAARPADGEGSVPAAAGNKQAPPARRMRAADDEGRATP